jgi:hypothetical protein
MSTAFDHAQALYDAAEPDWIEEEEMDEPTMDELNEMADEGVATATDGCSVEPDGVCPHGSKSWLLVLGWI